MVVLTKLNWIASQSWLIFSKGRLARNVLHCISRSTTFFSSCRQDSFRDEFECHVVKSTADNKEYIVQSNPWGAAEMTDTVDEIGKRRESNNRDGISNRWNIYTGQILTIINWLYCPTQLPLTLSFLVSLEPQTLKCPCRSDSYKA